MYLAPVLPKDLGLTGYADNVAGVQFTVLCIVMLISTLVPKVDLCPVCQQVDFH